MRNYRIIFLMMSLLCVFTFIGSNAQHDESNCQKTCSAICSDKKGAYYTGEYPNLFKELLGKSDEEIKSKIEFAFNQLFYGNDDNERIYYPVGNDMAYILDFNNKDVRTEGMTYGMMIAVQLNKKNEFDRLWKWTKTFMQHQNGQRKDYFAWHCKSSGEMIDSGSAADGEEWFVTTLFLASARWGDGKGIYNYKREAQNILDAMLSKVESSDDRNVVTNLFNKKEKQIVFVPDGSADDFTDPSYHLPHYYELWARWADKENDFWKEVAETSRAYLKKAVNPVTGLAPDYSKFDGTPYSPWGGGNDNFQYDAWRVAANVAIDYIWFQKDEWAVTQSNRLLNFFYSLGIKDYGGVYTLDGKKQFAKDHSTGLVAMNAAAALASNDEKRKEFVAQLWDVTIPAGTYRYYDGVLYMLGLLQVSGNYKIYDLK
jgi:oligosaccharide reducing-end xylanase